MGSGFTGYSWSVSKYMPVYLDDKVQDYLTAKADAKGVEFTDLVNDMLRKDIELIEMARQFATRSQQQEGPQQRPFYLGDICRKVRWGKALPAIGGLPPNTLITPFQTDK
jgi:hypothetical protein